MEIQINDLRIGNYVRDHYTDVLVVTGIREYEGKGIGFGNLHVKPLGSKEPSGFKPVEKVIPIKLTEEWLLKFGFRKNGHVTFLSNAYQRFMLGRNSMYSLNGIDFIYDVNDHSLCEIKHVHQLQNLYFALTGEKLKLKQ
jgi:hypothetical protein